MFRAKAIPAFLLCDRRSLWQYGLGAVRPFTFRLGRFLEQGYLVSGDTPGELAGSLGIDRAGLERTIAQYNADAARGVDTRFNLGGDDYQRFSATARTGPTRACGRSSRHRTTRCACTRATSVQPRDSRPTPMRACSMVRADRSPASMPAATT